MKTLFTVLLLAAGVASQAQTRFKTDSVYLSGTVQNAAKHLDSADAVEVTVNDLALDKQLTYRSKINRNGSYQLAFIKTGAQKVIFEYNGEATALLITPGAHMQIDFDGDNFDKTLVFNGENAQTNRDLQAYKRAFDRHDLSIYGRDSYGKLKSLMAAQKDKQPAEYRQYMAKRYKQDSLFLQNYIKQHQLTPLFTQWATADLQCEHLAEIMRYLWVHPRQNNRPETSFVLPTSYFNFLSDPKLNDPKLAVSVYYGWLAAEYQYYLSSKSQMQDTMVATEMRNIFNLPPGLLKEVMICNFFSSKINEKKASQLSDYINQFKLAVTEPTLRNTVLAAYQATLPSGSVPLTGIAGGQKTDLTDADKLLAGIIGKYAGRVVYIDFWGTWCHPCLNEMPKSKMLHDHYAGKNIAFVYLAAETPEDEWKATIKKYNLPGEHLRLNRNELSALSSKFQIGVFPRYMLVDKTGRVADDNARRPSDNKLTGDIDKLLAVK